MQPMIFGMETELAFAAFPRTGGPSARPLELVTRLFTLARRRLVSLPEARGHGLFLANGARFYLDMGNHPEICTPECQSPAEVVRWQLACERIVSSLTAALEAEHPGVEMALFRCNVDYSGSGNTWGCHESYQHRSSQEELAPALIPHLVTRIVYTGAGGFDNLKRRPQFVLSPRTPQLSRAIGGDSMERGIYNTRDEPLSSGGFSRLHVICGESLCSELSNYLKIGTTALIVRLIEVGAYSAARLAIRCPLESMRKVATDTSLRRTVELFDGRRLTAVQVQAEYLAIAEANLGADFMPPWAKEVCRRWRQVLERLEKGAGEVATSLDWAIKLALFERHRGLAASGRSGRRKASDVDAELCEIDTRFGELSQRSIFGALDEAGALDHRIEERGAIEDAMETPPPGGRAELRGRVIRSILGDRSQYQCGWGRIVDAKEDLELDLSDPFATHAEWRALRLWQAPERRAGEEGLDAGLAAYYSQNPDLAVEAFGRTIEFAAANGPRDSLAMARFWCAAAHHDAGRLAAAEEVIAPAAGDEDVSPWTRIRVLTRVALLRIERPAPLAEVEQAVRAARDAWQSAGAGAGSSRIELVEACLFGARGMNAAAVAKAEDALRAVDADPLCFCPSSTVRWLLKFLLRVERYRRVVTHLDRGRGRLHRLASPVVLRVILNVAESGLMLRLGRREEALARAASALDHSARFGRQRLRLSACIAYLEAAAASGVVAAIPRVLEELRAWSDVEIGELVLERLQAEALALRALEDRRAAGAARSGRSTSDPGFGSFDETVRAARAAAERLDALLDCRYHLPALEARLR